MIRSILTISIGFFPLQDPNTALDDLTLTQWDLLGLANQIYSVKSELASHETDFSCVYQ